ncbi:thioredoxin H7-like [Pistacia vera]|uniref:thioredoxin H7-like n=1 Tax=Pistacia vera TaxID=55513 RepID=UPI001262F717|nr:thioredoxin H7-like [Pistacia vera]XP_031277815.1 thioredoxin H7-like [Pistacia vera]
MGANMSDFENPHGFSPVKTNQLIECHSKNQWKAQFDANKETSKLTVVYFTATWCGPCKFLEPYIKELAAKYSDVLFIKIDIDKLAAVAREFELIDVVPTMAFVKKGKEIDRVVGAKKEEVQMKIEKHRTF